MKKLLLPILLALAFAATASAQEPQVVTMSEASVAGAIEVIENLDAIPLYRLTVNLDPRRHSVGTNVEYEIFTASGDGAGGGMFTIRPEMLSADGRSIAVLTGFGGLELGADSRVVVKLVDLASVTSQAGPKRLVGADGIVDTCTSYCERCAVKAETLCDEGVVTYECGCGADSRTCKFTCKRKV